MIHSNINEIVLCKRVEINFPLGSHVQMGLDNVVRTHSLRIERGPRLGGKVQSYLYFDAFALPNYRFISVSISTIFVISRRLCRISQQRTSLK
jgi:hypothetical protein